LIAIVIHGLVSDNFQGSVIVSIPKGRHTNLSDSPVQIVRTLIHLYTHNYVCTRWREAVSHYFAVTNGVKQGAVLSPILFCIYIDNLLKLLADTGVGCYIGSHFVGALAYADDIVLLAPTASAMRRLLAVCDEYSREYCISFNVSKTKCLVAMPRSRHVTFDRVGDCLFFFL
jgi:hypothetical protein